MIDNFINDNDKIKLLLSHYKEGDKEEFYNIINESYIPSAYIPFYHNIKDNDINNNILSNNIILKYEDFNDITISNTTFNNIEKKNYIQNNLQTEIKNINNEDKIYNKFYMTKFIIMTLVMWIFIFFCILKTLYYYAYEYYGIIIILLTTIILIFSVLWKIFITMQDI